jgi:hypothetical protein
MTTIRMTVCRYCRCVQLFTVLSPSTGFVAFMSETLFLLPVVTKQSSTTCTRFQSYLETKDRNNVVSFLEYTQNIP